MGPLFFIGLIHGKYQCSIKCVKMYQYPTINSGEMQAIYLAMIPHICRRAQEVVFSTIGNVHSTPLSDKFEVVLELVSPITLWILWKQQCGRVFSNQSAHPTMLLQEIWSESVATLKSQYDGLWAALMELKDNE